MKLCKRNQHEFEGSYCKECFKDYRKRYYIENKEKILKINRNYAINNTERLSLNNKKLRNKNLEKFRKRSKDWYKANPDKVKKFLKKYARSNPDVCNAKNAKYRASKLKATPIWLNEVHIEQIKSFYVEAKKLESIDNIIRHVDHIIPLQGITVCGLHVPWNLQILTAEENQTKKNKLL